jgi:flagellar protein FliJ
MRRFEFKLEKVREFRRMLEEQAKKELQDTQRRVLEAEDELVNMLNKRQQSLSTALKSVQDRLAMQSYIAKLDDDRTSQESVIAILKQDEEYARQLWIHARQEAEALEKLREKAKEEYDQEAARIEQAELDEWANTRRAA